MKWVTLTLLVLTLVLIAGAGFRLMTAPASEVRETREAMAERVDEVAKEQQLMIQEESGTVTITTGTSSAESEEDPWAEWSSEAEVDQYKQIELTGETLEEYDDQEIKGRRLNEAKDLIGARFGTD